MYILQGLCMGFQSQLKKDQYHFIVQLTKATLPLLSSTAVQATIPRPKGDHVQVSMRNVLQPLYTWLPGGGVLVAGR